MSTHPEVLWAQRSSESAPEKNVVYLTVNLPDIAESTIEYALTSTDLSFKATAGRDKANYAFDLDFYAEVDPEQSTKRLTSRSLSIVLRKKEQKSEYWPRLTKEKRKTPFIKTDFSKWVDEDEQDGNTGVDDEMVGGFPGMEDGMSGMGGGMDFEQMMQQTKNLNSVQEDAAESDEDDGPPPLEEVETSK